MKTYSRKLIEGLKNNKNSNKVEGNIRIMTTNKVSKITKVTKITRKNSAECRKNFSVS